MIRPILDNYFQYSKEFIISKSSKINRRDRQIR